MNLAQYSYTSFDDPQTKLGGWGFQHQVGLSAEQLVREQDFLANYKRLVPVEEVPLFVRTQEDKAQLARRLSLTTTSGKVRILHETPAGKDGSGRPDNTYTQTVILAREQGVALCESPLQLLTADFWQIPLGAGEVAHVPLTPIGQPVAPMPAAEWLPVVEANLASFLELLDRLEQTVDYRRAGNENRELIVIRLPQMTQAVYWLAAIHALVLAGDAWDIHFSTYERHVNPTRAHALLISGFDVVFTPDEVDSVTGVMHVITARQGHKVTGAMAASPVSVAGGHSLHRLGTPGCGSQLNRRPSGIGGSPLTRSTPTQRSTSFGGGMPPAGNVKQPEQSNTISQVSPELSQTQQELDDTEWSSIARIMIGAACHEKTFVHWQTIVGEQSAYLSGKLSWGVLVWSVIQGWAEKIRDEADQKIITGAPINLSLDTPAGQKYRESLHRLLGRSDVPVEYLATVVERTADPGVHASAISIVLDRIIDEPALLKSGYPYLRLRQLNVRTLPKVDFVDAVIDLDRPEATDFSTWMSFLVFLDALGFDFSYDAELTRLVEHFVALLIGDRFRDVRAYEKIADLSAGLHHIISHSLGIKLVQYRHHYVGSVGYVHPDIAASFQDNTIVNEILIWQLATDQYADLVADPARYADEAANPATVFAALYGAAQSGYGTCAELIYLVNKYGMRTELAGLIHNTDHPHVTPIAQAIASVLLGYADTNDAREHARAIFCAYDGVISENITDHAVRSQIWLLITDPLALLADSAGGTGIAHVIDQSGLGSGQETIHVAPAFWGQWYALILYDLALSISCGTGFDLQLTLHVAHNVTASYSDGVVGGYEFQRAAAKLYEQDYRAAAVLVEQVFYAHLGVCPASSGAHFLVNHTDLLAQIFDKNRSIGIRTWRGRVRDEVAGRIVNGAHNELVRSRIGPGTKEIKKYLKELGF
ncbi:MAG: hypothetical protein GX483_01045 [Actinomycetaceae bacterium]|nr:hypothetical protein [Actinomycetaceae bacterium]